MARSVCLQIIMRIHTITKSDILSCCLVVRYWSLNQRLCCVIHTMLLWKTVLWRESSCYLVVILVTPWADRAVAGIVMLFGCHTGHAMGGPCCSGNRHAIWLSYWSRHGRTVLQRESSCYLVVILVTPSASLLCYTYHVVVKDRAVAGIVMLFGCHTGHAIGVFVVLYITCCCEGPCCSGNRVQLELIILLNFDTATANEMYPLS